MYNALTTLNAVKITDRVYWVGAVDWGLRDFHGYATQRGSTYNAFLILADKITLIDTVKKPFKDEMLSRIASVTDPSNINIIISNHAEMDHSGCLPEMISQVKPEKVFASTMGKKALTDHFNLNDEITPVKEGERLDIGDAHLSFIETPLLHWPDSMFTFLEEEGIIFTQDAFGCHLATDTLFANEVDQNILEYELSKYYANILLLYSKRILRLFKKIKNLGLSIKMILPDHGPLWTDRINRPLELYTKWAEQKPENKAVIIYDTMWGSTALMAKIIAETIPETKENKDVQVKLLPIKGTHRSDVATELLCAGALLAGSPTINNNIFPSVIDTLSYIKGLKPQNLIGAAFGSYGWSGEAIKQINYFFNEMNIELVSDGIRHKYIPDENALEECQQLGRLIGNKLFEICGKEKKQDG